MTKNWAVGWFGDQKNILLPFLFGGKINFVSFYLEVWHLILASDLASTERKQVGIFGSCCLGCLRISRILFLGWNLLLLSDYRRKSGYMPDFNNWVEKAAPKMFIYAKTAFVWLQCFCTCTYHTGKWSLSWGQLGGKKNKKPTTMGLQSNTCI